MADAAKLRLQQGAVRLTMPARVANDLDGIQGALGERRAHLDERDQLLRAAAGFGERASPLFRAEL